MPGISKMHLPRGQTKFKKPVIRFCTIIFSQKNFESEPKMPIAHSTEKKNMPYITHIKKKSHHYIRPAADPYIVLSIIATA